ncbi:MAG: hypothetical protein NHB32_22520 [Fischerella sp. CENA71]|nr:hypothetical protein [Fischerella sp. CENA71]
MRTKVLTINSPKLWTGKGVKAMYDIPIPENIIYLIVKIGLLILVLSLWLATTATPAY